ncbi:hypothetical protein VHEMI07651 [[Torrubiella] hemipterigena]|uniref:Uncharacterized protein n=1 Tax=[Torrubiella] hemipterigena TaxID=1531966 RepID=A0A0A1TLQ8_9HYPO|nr:hypothetical protein VHEMI07651 [[Torrubiella] hemipterigena]
MIAPIADHTNKPPEQIEIDERRIYGVNAHKNDKDLVVSVFTYPGSEFFWASTLPQSLGWVEAANRLAQSNILNAQLPKKRYVIHAEESAFSKFEFDVFRWVGKAEGKYPLGSVVGTWHRKGAKDSLKGTYLSTCWVDAREGDENIKKGNRACEVVTKNLQISARVRGVVTIRPEASVANCARDLETRDNSAFVSAACQLPIRPKPSSKGVSTLVTSTRRESLVSTSQGAEGSSAKKSAAKTNTRNTKPIQTGADLHSSTKIKVTATAVAGQKKPASTKAGSVPGNTHAGGALTKPATARASAAQKPKTQKLRM